MKKKQIFVLQSELAQPIDKLLLHFSNLNLQNRINKLDIKYFEYFIGNADILVKSELHYLKDFMILNNVNMIYLDCNIQNPTNNLFNI